MENFDIILMLWLVAIIMFDLLPYLLATIIIGRFPPGGPFVMQFFTGLYSRFKPYPTWHTIGKRLDKEKDSNHG